MPRREQPSTPGGVLALRLERGMREAEGALRPGARDLPVLRGVTDQCRFSIPLENVLMAQCDIWRDSQRVFVYGDNVVQQAGNMCEGKLITLAADRRVEPAAAASLSNLYICEIASQGGDCGTQFPPPSRLIELGVNSEPTLARLPRITVYAKRPVFDRDFIFRGPGWHGDVGYLVHGIEVEPVIPTTIPTAGCNLGRLQPHLRRGLQDFCFRSEADVANAAGMLLTGLLIDHFIADGKPIALLDANQPGVGKTLLVSVWSEILDGESAKVIKFTPDDDELTKQIVARLRSKPATILLFDNAKLKTGAEISSPMIEANSTAPSLALRILGTSSEHRQPNDLIWCITMNRTKAGRDIMQRGVPIRQQFEGDPRERNLDPAGLRHYVRSHRRQILGELAGMVIRWNQHGRPHGNQRHRLNHWASIIGGILDANGITDFLANLDEAAIEFNSELDELTAIAEAAVQARSAAVQFIETDAENPTARTNSGLTAGQFAPLFSQTTVLADKLATAKSSQAKSTLVGNFLALHLEKTVPIEVDHRAGQATLRRIEGRSNRKLYVFEVRWNPASDEIMTSCESVIIPGAPAAQMTPNFTHSITPATQMTTSTAQAEHSPPPPAVTSAAARGALSAPPASGRRSETTSETSGGNSLQW